jgi:hypothetical protein
LGYSKIISRHNLVLGEQPEKNLNPRRNFKLPDSRQVYRGNPSKIDDGIQTAGRINPRRTVLPN